MNKLCLVYNFAPKYREGIFRLIDKEYSCDWYFGKNNTDIKGLDLSILNSVRQLSDWRIPHTPFYYQCGVPSLLWRKEYQVFFMLGELYSLSTWWFLILRKLFFPKKKVYFWTHGWYGKETPIRKVLKKVFFKAVDGIFLYGNYAKRLMIEEGFDEKKLFVIHNSLNYEKQMGIRKQLQASDIYKAHFNDELPTLIFIGRLTKVKRLDLLLDALEALKEKNILFNLTLVGDGEEKEHLKAKVKELGLEKQVWFYGACYDEKKNAELIFNADLCVSPGNVGLTAMHTMMFGCPVITHNNFPYQMPEFEAIHEGTTGDFFEYDNVGAIANCIESWFAKHRDNREAVRLACYHEIDTQWNPLFQMEVIKKYL